GKRVSIGCGRKRRSVRVLRWICGVKPELKAANKPLHHSIVHVLDKPGSSATVSIIVDSTLQRRASLHPENAKTFNHGHGFVIGHQWTNIVLILNDMLIPLRPIPFYSQTYCREHQLEYQTEHALVV